MLDTRLLKLQMESDSCFSEGKKAKSYEYEFFAHFRLATDVKSPLTW